MIPMRWIYIVLILIITSCQKNEKEVVTTRPVTKNTTNKNTTNVMDSIPLVFSEKWNVEPSNIDGIQFFLFYADNTNAFQDNINLMTEDLQAGMSLEAYTDLTMNYLKDVKEKEIIGQSNIKVNGNDARIIEYNANLTGLYLYYYQQYMVNNGKSYVLTFSSDMEDADELKDDVREIFLTFKLPD